MGYMFTIGIVLVGVVILNKLAPFCPVFFRRAFHWLYALTFELIAILSAQMLRIFFYIFPMKQRLGDPSGTPILLIHGYLHNSSGWFLFRRALAKRKLGPIYTIDLFHPFWPISKYAELIEKKREAIRRETGKEELKLVGHSMGGLAALWYAAHLAKIPTQVITLGSPLHGTYAAFLALGQNGKEMRPRSFFMKEMKEILMRKEFFFYHLGSMSDQLILPASSAFTGQNSKREYRIEDLGHMSLLFSPCVFKKVVAWLHEDKES
ncbi:MAG TPA: alpha/beta hydrolase [Chlamydiales bacterium]|nr:alpha/beta hydrolase [Chlamydiales bacterium]